MYIEKKQTMENQCRCQMIYCMRARDALKVFLARHSTPGSCLFIPSYIGVSPKEGSGLYDPVKETGIDHSFYQMSPNLEIDRFDLLTQLNRWPGEKMLLLVHYWGYVDPQYEAVVARAREIGCIVIEDMAHAIFTEYVDHQCGYLADVSFYSFHKMLPLESGGALKIQNEQFFDKMLPSDSSGHFPIEYDFTGIAKKRKENAVIWETLLAQHPDIFEILRPVKDFPNNTPQTFPVRLLRGGRYELYSEMNRRGYGLISLYHTLISPLQNPKYEKTLQLSSQILNFPVHQDVTERQILNMYDELLSCCDIVRS